MIQVQNISFSYGDRPVLQNVSFQAEAGQCVGILGNNGAGKSTLITCINKIRTSSGGTVIIDGRKVSEMGRGELARTIAYVAQKNELSQMTVFDSVLLGRKPYIRWAASEEDIGLCEAVIRQVGLESSKLRYVDELSGGEQQKVMLARALVQQPKLLLLDEPTSNLDPGNQYEMLSLVRRLIRERQITACIVLHDLNLALRYCDRFFFLKEGKGYSYGDSEIVTEETIEAVYGISAEIVTIKERKIVVIG